MVLSKNRESIRYIDSYPVYRTSNSKFAVIPPFFSDSSFNELIKPINFQPTLNFNIINRGNEFLEMRYPKEFYEYNEHTAVCNSGVYVSDLFDYLKENDLNQYSFE